MTQERMQGPIYQVDTQNAASGKRLSATKRRVRWRFGFGNREALSQGMTGVDCRGEEHEVVLVWSLTSGKRLIIADGQEVYFNIGRRMDSKFETSWSMHNHVFKIVAHAAPPLVEQPGFRQFDLIIDGMSFHSFPRIFELGFRSSRNRYSLAVSDDRLGFATPLPTECTTTTPRKRPRITRQLLFLLLLLQAFEILPWPSRVRLLCTKIFSPVPTLMRRTSYRTQFQTSAIALTVLRQTW